MIEQLSPNIESHKNREAGFARPQIGWRRHSASNGYCPHPSNPSPLAPHSIHNSKFVQYKNLHLARERSSLPSWLVVIHALLSTDPCVVFGSLILLKPEPLTVSGRFAMQIRIITPSLKEFVRLHHFNAEDFARSGRAVALPQAYWLQPLDMTNQSAFAWPDPASLLPGRASHLSAEEATLRTFLTTPEESREPSGGVQLLKQNYSYAKFCGELICGG